MTELGGGSKTGSASLLTIGESGKEEGPSESSFFGDSAAAASSKNSTSGRTPGKSPPAAAAAEEAPTSTYSWKNAELEDFGDGAAMLLLGLKGIVQCDGERRKILQVQCDGKEKFHRFNAMEREGKILQG